MPAIKLKKVTAEYLAEKEREEKSKEKSKKSIEEVAEEENKTSEDEETPVEEESKPRNFLEVEILFDKRKRAPPPAEQKLTDWLDSNLIAKDNVNLPLSTLYEYYSEVCQMQGEPVVDVPVFNRYIRDKFGKSFGFQENSPYRVLIKERKVKEKKPKVVGETMQIKIREIITNVINDLGNPTKGLRFQVISKTIVQKYPAKRVDLYPHKLKSALERGVMYSYIERVRGVGMCGYYRVPGEPTKDETEEKKDKAKTVKEETTTEDEGESKENGDTAEASGESEGKSTDDEKKVDDASEEKPATDEVTETEEKTAKKKTQRKKKKKPVVEKWARSNLAKHSDPERVEDVFPLAITYQTDPKEASGGKIKSYISKFYATDVSNDRLKKALDSGVDSGMWELTSGNAPTGRYHLLVDTFNPGRSDSMKDRISQALVACNEPKQASAGLIKKYITQYHPKLNVEVKPHLFRHALERACSKGSLRQLSGIGASGTFQLAEPFFPSPAILAGDSSDSEEEEADVDGDEAPEYVPRPTKRTKSAPKPKPLKAPVTQPAKRSKPNTKVEEKKASVKGKDRNARARNARKAVVSGSESEEEEVVEYTPKPTKRRGGSSAPVQQKDRQSKQAKTSASKARGKSVKGTKSQRSAAKSQTVVESDAEDAPVDLDEHETPMEYTPRPSKSRGGPATPKSGTQRSGSRNVKRALIDDSQDADDDASDEEAAPSPPKKRKSGQNNASQGEKKSPKAKSSSRRRR